MAASRLLRAAAVFIILLFFVAGSRKSSWSEWLHESCAINLLADFLHFGTYVFFFVCSGVKTFLRVSLKKIRLSREGHSRDKLSSNCRSFIFGKFPPPACPGICKYILCLGRKISNLKIFIRIF